VDVFNINDEFKVVNTGLTVVGIFIDSLPAINVICIAKSNNTTPKKSPVEVRYGIHTLSGFNLSFQANITKP